MQRAWHTKMPCNGRKQHEYMGLEMVNVARYQKVKKNLWKIRLETLVEALLRETLWAHLRSSIFILRVKKVMGGTLVAQLDLLTDQLSIEKERRLIYLQLDCVKN